MRARACTYAAAVGAARRSAARRARRSTACRSTARRSAARRSTAGSALQFGPFRFLAVALANSRFGHGVFVTCVSYLANEQHKYTVNTALLLIALQKVVLVT